MLIIYFHKVRNNEFKIEEWQPEHTLFGNKGSRVLIVVVGVRGGEKSGGNHSLVVWSNGRTLKSESSAMIQSRKVEKRAKNLKEPGLQSIGRAVWVFKGSCEEEQEYFCG